MLDSNFMTKARSACVAINLIAFIYFNIRRYTTEGRMTK